MKKNPTSSDVYRVYLYICRISSSLRSPAVDTHTCNGGISVYFCSMSHFGGITFLATRLSFYTSYVLHIANEGDPHHPKCFSGVKMDTSATIPNQNDQNSELRSIPWTISNKYYKAHVHFQAHEIRFWSSTLADGVPAIIFVWGSGEVCKFPAFLVARLGRAAYT